MSQPTTNPIETQRLKGRWLFWMLALLAALLIVGLLVLSRGPMHKGKTVSYWVDHGCSQAAGSETFRVEIKEIGPPTVPLLIKKLRTQNTVFRRIAMRTRNRLPGGLKNLLPDYEDAASVRAAAADCLAMLGPDAKPAVPDLIKLLNDESVATHAANALGQIGPDAKAALPILKSFLTKPFPVSQADAARALWKINRDTNAVLKVFTWSLIPSPEERFLVNAIPLLGPLGAAADSAVPDLVRILGDPSRSPAARGNAALMLGQIGLKNSEVMAALLAGTADLNGQIKWRCALSLWRLDDQYVNLAVPLVVDYVSHIKGSIGSGSQFVRLAGGHSRNVRTAIPALQALLSNDDPEVRRVAGEALKELDATPSADRSDK